MYSTLSRVLLTWVPVGTALLVSTLHSRSTWLAVALGQLLLLSLSGKQISEHEAQVGQTTYATWLFLLLVGGVILLSFFFWLFADMKI